MSKLEKISYNCNYTSYTQKYLNYPPTTSDFPLPIPSIDPDGIYCDIWDLIINVALILIPAFDIYFIYQMPPITWSVMP